MPDDEPLRADVIEVDRNFQISAETHDLADGPRTKSVVHNRLTLHKTWQILVESRVEVEIVVIEIEVISRQ